ncbi:MAG TPA: hypothetical protein VFQ61_18895, partial [Polyangiaceae bacterium]|nr:hypothetical protein [Polyangiaceae bacterium]
LCIALGGLAACIMAECFAFHRGKQLLSLTAQDLSTQLTELEEQLFSHRDWIQSVTLLFPSWANSGAGPNTQALERVLTLLRKAELGYPVGLLTARTPALLSTLIVKSCVLPLELGSIAVVGAQSDAPPIPASREDPAREFFTQADLLHRNADPGLDFRVEHLDETRSPAAVVRALHHEPIGTLIFRGHSRPYCGLEGRLCASPASQQPTQAECVLGLDCYDASWPKVDPRSFGAELVVLETCSALTASTTAWEDGGAPIAILASESRATAVLTTAAPTVMRDVSFLLSALTRTRTVGEAGVLFDQSARSHQGCPSVFLLGDPDQPLPNCFFGAVPEIGREHDAGAVAALGGSDTLLPRPIYQRYALPGVREKTTVRVTGDLNDVEQASLCLIPGASHSELWLRSRRRNLDVCISPTPVPRFPTEVLSAAVALPARLLSFTGLASAGVPGLLQACRSVVQCQAHLESLADRATAYDFEGYVRSTILDWWAAHRDFLESTLTQRGQSFWIDNVCSPTGPTSRHSTCFPCAQCGRASVTIRSYDVFPAGARQARECEHCASALDFPEPHRELSMRVAGPDQIRVGDTEQFSALLENASTTSSVWGAVALFLDGFPKGTNVSSSPSIIPFHVPAGGRVSLGSELRVDTPTIPAHWYRAKAIAFLDGHWFLSAKMLRVRR